MSEGVVFYDSADEDQIEPTEWHYFWEDSTGSAIRYFASEAEYETHLQRVRRASFGGEFDEREENLLSLLLHPDTSEFPELDDYRESFIQNYFHLKQRIEHERKGKVYCEGEFDAWSREVATLELKADLQQVVLEGRPQNRQDHGYGIQALHPAVHNMIIELCEEHEGAVLGVVMKSRWDRVLRHVPPYVEHAGEDLDIPFEAYIRAREPQEVAYVQQHIRLRKDNSTIRFIDDLTFLLVQVWMRLHDGHELYCTSRCTYREEMGARLRALYVYGCLTPANPYDAQPNTSLQEILELHLTDGDLLYYGE
ncbi:hypothetical protein L211DRAFT_837618 [Terfezia boudieri ATCC MYA-4762]|uniref:Uncharacterized protein n=1 Tax=Terfezia boudieri ATCC MYA-4762 TaxID=1051890 RepID=A0A3N4LSN1_9PEZI|nr:hypothetical protein L211DRAFT_837618 [Terfezia boudieri ATCC MYA-4762]